MAAARRSAPAAKCPPIIDLGGRTWLVPWKAAAARHIYPAARGRKGFVLFPPGLRMELAECPPEEVLVALLSDGAECIGAALSLREAWWEPPGRGDYLLHQIAVQQVHLRARQRGMDFRSLDAPGWEGGGGVSGRSSGVQQRKDTTQRSAHAHLKS